MSAYVIAGLVLGGVYAISAVGLVLTYASSRVFNFGHGAIAFFVASTYYELNTRQGWDVTWAALVSIVVVGPAVGVLLWAVLFRWLTHAPEAVKLVSTIGLYVAIPPLALILYGDEPIFRSPGLSGTDVRLYDVFGVTLNSDQIIVLVSAAIIAAGLTLVLRYTTFGLAIRAVVDSEAMSSLVGTNTSLVAAGAWAIGAFLAGLAGVLVSPILNLDPINFALLVVASFSAVVVARLSSLTWAFGGAMLLGLMQSFIVKYPPTDNPVIETVLPFLPESGIRPSLPFFLMAAFLLAYSYGGMGREQRPRDTRAVDTDAVVSGEVRAGLGLMRLVYPSLAVVVVLALPVMLNDFWIGLVASGLAFSIVFLSYTVVTGEGGMLSLCQVTFAGIGAIAAAQLATEYNWPVLLAIVAGGVIAVPFGLLIAGLAIRLGGLYLGLATLAFALLMDNLVFQIDDFYKLGSGVFLDRPALGSYAFESDVRLYYLLMAFFALIALIVWNLRRSTTGLVLGAMRSTEIATATLGFSIIRAKLVAFGLSSFIAGVGGGLLATYSFRAHPPSYNALYGLIWLAVTVTWGIRSAVGALIAGVTFAILPQLVSDYLPESLQQLPPVLFGLGAIGLAREPRGVIVMNANAVRALRRRLSRRAAKPALAGGPQDA